MLRKTRLIWLFTIVLTLVTRYALAKFPAPTDAPVDRLVRNLEAYIKEHPKDPQGYYNLARVHSLAFTLQTKSLAAYEHGGLPHPADEEMQKSGRKPQPRPNEQEGRKPSGDKAEAPTEAELLAHLNEAVRNFNKAIELSKDSALYYLSLGSVLEAGESQSSKCEQTPLNLEVAIEDRARDHASRIVVSLANDKRSAGEAEQILKGEHWWYPSGHQALIAALHAARHDEDEDRRNAVRRLLDLHWKEAVTDCYFRAFALALPHDAKRGQKGLRDLKDFVSYEAAQNFLRVAKSRAVPEQDKVRIQTAAAAVAALEKLPPSGEITPVIFSTAPSRSLSQLVATRTTVRFDLDGTGRPQQWTWVRPETGILVWDPCGSGRITCGRQLFGSVTWWMFWENGYRALDALDDNRDGVLSGDELAGLAVWFDRNSNGVSDPGEVTPVAKLGIAAIACRETTESEGCLANLRGLTLTDGTELPTYDWIALRASEDKGSILGFAFLSLPLFVCLVACRRMK